jgi:hypothetical protein
MLAQGAIAQCVAPSQANAARIPAVAETARPAATNAANAKARPAPELIQTAAAGTRDDAPPVMHEASQRNGQDHPRRGGTAMLLAALALMSGIALRRYGARRP